jgi:transcriptional regulator with XRE-family HTH domain
VGQKPAGNAPWDAFGTYLRNQRQLAQLSLRQLADLTKVSNPYLSQIERGLHRPSIAIIKSLAEALNLSTSDLLAHAADIVTDEESATNTEGVIRSDPLLNDAQKSALLAVYRSMVDSSPEAGASTGRASSTDVDGEDTGDSAKSDPEQTATESPSRPRSRSGTTRSTRKKTPEMP